MDRTGHSLKAHRKQLLVCTRPALNPKSIRAAHLVGTQTIQCQASDNKTMPASSTSSPDYISKTSLLQGRIYCKHQDKGPSDTGLGLNRGSHLIMSRGKKQLCVLKPSSTNRETFWTTFLKYLTFRQKHAGQCTSRHLLKVEVKGKLALDSSL